MDVKPFNYTILNRVFSKSSLEIILSGYLPASVGAVIRRNLISPIGKTNGGVISEIYQFMDRNYRNEYFYKNTLLNKLVISSKKHNLKNTIALSEIPVCRSKADFVLINGQAEVYEIKTELDNLDRFDTQIQDYYKVFDRINLVTCKAKVNRLMSNLKFPKLGIYKLMNGRLYTLKESASEQNYLEHKNIFKVLRKYEYENIIFNYFGKLPNVSQFEYYKECLRWFSKIDIEEAYMVFVAELRKRISIEKHPFLTLPDAMKSLVYFKNMKSKDIAKLSEFFNSEYRGENVLSIS